MCMDRIRYTKSEPILFWKSLKLAGESTKQGNLKLVPMVLNPHGIEPIFLRLGSLSPGAGFIPIIAYNVLKWIKEEIM